MRGLTMIELMVVVGIVGVLVTFAAPSFMSAMQSNRAVTQINALAGDMEFARSEAIKRGRNILVCASSDASTCLATGVWHTGWIVYDPADPVPRENLRTQPAWTSSDTLNANSNATGTPAVPSITFNRDGFAVLNGATLWTLKNTPVNNNATRCLVMSMLGQPQVLRYNNTAYGRQCT